jgi:hypothetical protein
MTRTSGPLGQARSAVPRRRRQNELVEMITRGGDAIAVAVRAHIILDGEMTLTCGGSTRTFKAGERPPDVPAGAVHSARMGPSECRYPIGESSAERGSSRQS